MKPGTFLVRAPAALPFLLLFYALVWNSALPYSVSAALVVFFVASALRPVACLQILTALVPFTIAWAWSWSRTVRWAEALTITFLAGALLHLAIHPRRNPSRTRVELIAFGFAALVATSWVTELVVLQNATDYPVHFIGIVWQLFTRDFFRDPGVFVRLNEALYLLEGIALLVCVRRLSATDPALPHSLLRMTVLGATASAGLNGLRVVEILARQGPAAFIAIAPSLRFSVSHSDVNAAGSYFAMVLPMALGLAAWRLKSAGWAVGGALIAAALWFTGSRVGMASAAIGVVGFLTGCIVILRHRRIPSGIAVLALIVALGVIGAVVMLYPAQRNIAASVAMDVRTDMAYVAIELFKTRPVFGVGVGTFWNRSAEYIPARWKGIYTRENAHNNFLQILAELGALGLGFFLALLVVALRPLRPLHGPDATAVTGALSGVLAFLLSCLGGHPLLTREVLYPFWIVIGALSVLRETIAPSTAALRPPVVPRPWRRSWWWLAAGVTALALTIPFRVQHELRDRNFENVAIGYSMWSIGEDGARFRWAQPRSRFFVPGSAASALVPLRLGGQTADSVAVNVRLDGRLANRIIVVRDRWTEVRVVLSPARRPARYRVIELEIDAPPGTFEDGTSGNIRPQRGLMVGRVSLL